MEVRYSPDGIMLTGWSGNISATGVMVRAVRVFPPGTVLHLEIELGPSRFLKLRGVVRWACEGTVQLLPTGRIGMGIRFIDPPADLMKLVESAMSAPPANKAGQRR
jgi:hypothetical protein